MRSLRWLIALMLLALVAAACGGDDDDDAGGDTGGGTGGGEPAEFTLFGAPTGVEGDAMTGFIDVVQRGDRVRHQLHRVGRLRVAIAASGSKATTRPTWR